MTSQTKKNQSKCVNVFLKIDSSTAYQGSAPGGIGISEALNKRQP